MPGSGFTGFLVHVLSITPHIRDKSFSNLSHLEFTRSRYANSTNCSVLLGRASTVICLILTINHVTESEVYVFDITKCCYKSTKNTETNVRRHKAVEPIVLQKQMHKIIRWCQEASTNFTEQHIPVRYS